MNCLPRVDQAPPDHERSSDVRSQVEDNPMKSRLAALLVGVTLAASIAGCGDHPKPPDWIQGRWTAVHGGGDTNTWVFTEDNAVFTQTVSGRAETWDYSDLPGVSDSATDTTYVLNWEYQGMSATNTFKKGAGTPEAIVWTVQSGPFPDGDTLYKE